MLANRADFGRQGRRHAANGRAAFAVLTSHATLVAVVHDMAPHILIRPGAEPCYCGLNGCLESLVNARRLVVTYHRLRQEGAEPDLQDAKEILEAAVIQAASSLPGAALSSVNEMVQDLITGLNIFIYVYAPEVFVLGGGLAQGLAAFLPQIQQRLIAQPYHGFHSQVRISTLGEKAGLLDAASLAMLAHPPPL